MLEELREFDSIFDSMFDELSTSFDQVLNECDHLIDREFKGLFDEETKTTNVTKRRPLSEHALRTTFVPPASSTFESFTETTVLSNVHSTPPSHSVPVLLSSSRPKSFSPSSPKLSQKHSCSTSSLLPRLIARCSSSSPETEGKAPSTVPCALCGRKFLPERLDKHLDICKKTKQKKRKPFDSKQQRKVDENESSSPTRDVTSGSHHRRSASMTKSISSMAISGISPSRKPPGAKAAAPIKKTNWREQHEEFIKTVRAARGISDEVDESKKSRSSSGKFNSSDYDPIANGLYDAPKKIPAGYIKCPTCDRNFNRKAADRHIEWCAEQAKFKRLRSPTQGGDAMAKFKARTSYKATNGNVNGSSTKKPPITSPTKKAVTPTMPRRSFEKTTVVGNRVNTHRSVSPSRRLNGTNGTSSGPIVSNGRVKAIMESNRLKTMAPKTPVVKFKDKFPGAGKSVTSKYMQETESLKELFKRPDMNYNSSPRTVPGVRTGGMSPTRIGGFDDQVDNSRSSQFSSSISLMKRSLDDLYITQQATNGRGSGAITKNSTTERSSPVNGHRGSTSGSSGGAPREEEDPGVNPQGPMPRWCHQCGTKYPMTSAKYCYECGARRLGSLVSVS